MANVIAMCDLMVLINSNVMYNSRIKLRFVNPIASACNCVKSMSTLGSIHTLALHSMLLKVTRLACHRPVQRDRWIAPIAYTKETKMHNISNYGRWKKGFWGMRKGSGDRHFTHCPRCFVGSITSICPRAHKNDCLFSSYEDTDTFLDSCCYTAITNYKSGWAQWVRLGGRASRFIGLYNCLYRKRVEYCGQIKIV